MSARHDEYRRDWGPRADALNQLTETDAGSDNWRTARPAWQPPRDSAPKRSTGILAHMQQIARAARNWCAFEDLLLQPSNNRRDIAVFLVGVSWGLMCAIGVMAAWGIRP